MPEQSGCTGLSGGSRGPRAARGGRGASDTPHRRQGWKDGKRPEKVVVPRYDGLNSYVPDPTHT